jgi:PmbA protein
MSAAAPEALLKRALGRAAKRGAHAADAVILESESLEARVRGEEIDFVKQARERSLGLRVLVKAAEGLRSAATSSSDLSEAAVDRLADDTVALAEAIAPDPQAGLPEGGFAAEAPDLELHDPGDREVSVEERIETARRCEAAARGADARITNSEGSEVQSRFAHFHYANSAGFFGDYRAARHGTFSMPIAAENGAMQTDYWTTSARRLADLEGPEDVGRRAAERALRRLGSRRLATCEVPVIFEPLTARSLVGHLVACVSGGAVYRRSSYLADRLGDVVASEKVTLIDDGRLPRGLGSRPFDGEGLPTRRTVVIERGRLASFLLDTYAARRLGLASTGSAVRGAGGGPAAGPSNFWLEPGASSLEEMIAQTERGLLVTWLFGHGFNPVTGDFSRGAAGIWIEDGKLQHPVEEITIAGRFDRMLADVDAVGDELLWLGSVAAPALRIARLTVAGE